MADGGGASDAAGTCADAAACDDHLFCNGAETCAAGRCAAGTPPCSASSCDESTDRCRATVVDFDNDGDPATTDCDDEDRTRFTGNIQETNRCDNIDNDCDPSTLGPDSDGDGFSAVGCCNPQPDGSMDCGTDCNDSQATVSPAANEIPCNGADDNCNGTTDEGILPTFYLDADGDHYGSAASDATTMMACTRPIGYSDNNRDCNDSNELVNPERIDLCGNSIDEDCTGMADEGCRCMPSYGSRSCCGGRGTQMCVMNGTGWDWDTCTASIDVEDCDGVDDDCDTRVDEMAACTHTGETCRSGRCQCPTGQAVCGTACVNVRTGACDGSDADACQEGSWACNPTASAYTCSDTTGDSGTNARQCGASNDVDCDGNFYENLNAPGDCNPTSGNPNEVCYLCGGGFLSTPMSRGTHRCGSDCRWPSTCNQESTTWNDPASFRSGSTAPFSTTCPGLAWEGTNGGFVPYQGGSTCGMLYAPGVFPNGTYEITVGERDDGNLNTALFDVQVYQYSSSFGASIPTSFGFATNGFCRSNPFAGYRECGNNLGGVETYWTFRFVVTGCGSVAVVVGERPDNGFIGGNHVRIVSIRQI
ncbi:MAG: putative metal-binding motif-containing protein [Sandaracinus sp.]